MRTKERGNRRQTMSARGGRARRRPDASGDLQLDPLAPQRRPSKARALIAEYRATLENLVNCFAAAATQARRLPHLQMSPGDVDLARAALAGLRRWRTAARAEAMVAIDVTRDLYRRRLDSTSIPSAGKRHTARRLSDWHGWARHTIAALARAWDEADRRNLRAVEDIARGEAEHPVPPVLESQIWTWPFEGDFAGLKGLKVKLTLEGDPEEPKTHVGGMEFPKSKDKDDKDFTPPKLALKPADSMGVVQVGSRFVAIRAFDPVGVVANHPITVDRKFHGYAKMFVVDFLGKGCHSQTLQVMRNRGYTLAPGAKDWTAANDAFGKPADGKLKTDGTSGGLPGGTPTSGEAEKEGTKVHVDFPSLDSVITKNTYLFVQVTFRTYFFEVCPDNKTTFLGYYEWGFAYLFLMGENGEVKSVKVDPKAPKDLPQPPPPGGWADAPKTIDPTWTDGNKASKDAKSDLKETWKIEIK